MSGIIGIFSEDECEAHTTKTAMDLYYGLYALQHRGQVEAGLATLRGNTAQMHRGRGLVSEVFNEDSLQLLYGNKGVAHVKYSFLHEPKTSPVMPYVYTEAGKEGLLAIEGVFVHPDFTIAELVERLNGPMDALGDFLSQQYGAYAIVYVTPRRMVAVRDPHGIKALLVGRLGGSVVAASESCALDCIGVQDARLLASGEILMVEGGRESSYTMRNAREHLCMFEKIYIARPDSVIGDSAVYDARFSMGVRLYSEHKTDADIVIGAPDSGLIAAMGYAAASGIEYRDGIVKNRYIGRTFIAKTQEERDKAVFIKLNPIQRNLAGKRVVLVDDSIVRGTTIKRTLDILRRAGAKEVHVRIASPPVIKPCHISIDTPDEKSLLANGRPVEQMREKIGADSLYFLSLAGLLKASGASNHCVACFNGEYPIA